MAEDIKRHLPDSKVGTGVIAGALVTFSIGMINKFTEVTFTAEETGAAVLLVTAILQYAFFRKGTADRA